MMFATSEQPVLSRFHADCDHWNFTYYRTQLKTEIYKQSQRKKKEW